MKLYIISQDVNDDYDTYDSAVVAAESEEDAKTIHPSGREVPVEDVPEKYPEWSILSHIKVKLVGIAVEGTKRGVLVASYNAG